MQWQLAEAAKLEEEVTWLQFPTARCFYNSAFDCSLCTVVNHDNKAVAHLFSHFECVLFSKIHVKNTNGREGSQEEAKQKVCSIGQATKKYH